MPDSNTATQQTQSTPPIDAAKLALIIGVIPKCYIFESLV